LEFQKGAALPSVSIPKGFQAGRYEVVVRGRCPDCQEPGTSA